MKIAILGSVSISVPPTGQASVERLAYHQAVGLANLGHKIILFAPDGSYIDHPNVTIVPLGIPVGYPAVGNSSVKKDEEIYGAGFRTRLRYTHLAHLIEQLKKHRADYDVILNNLCEESSVLSVIPEINDMMYHILHLPIIPALSDVYNRYHTKLISISNAQRKAFPNLNYVSTVYNGVDTSIYSFSQNHEDYLLYLGSMGKNKNPKDAVLAALQTGLSMKIGGKIKDTSYFESEIKPHIDGKMIQWVGELSQEEIVKLYQKAKAYLFPTLWEEPFGLVAIEALSCGTPVIAYPNGGLVEIVESGVNGYLVNNLSEMVEKIGIIDQIDRKKCRETVEKKFSIEKMIKEIETTLRQTRP